ncbi:MAG: acyltransferase [Proteobacteria bacterium]|nr:acyltransferase [Pseudomonadota bacterium]
MTIYAVWAVPLLIAVLACVAASPLFAGADDPEARSDPVRVASIDGLRGYLAVAVVIHHGVITYGYLKTGQWEPPASGFFNQLGQASVALFFIITGFLFWGKILRAGGGVDFSSLLIGRAFRIGPVFVTLTVALMVSAVISQGPALVLPAKVLVAQGLQNLALGMLSVSSFNGVDIVHQVAGVTWTLVYEWEFYLLLPFLAPLAWRHDLSLAMLIGLATVVFLLATITHAPTHVIMCMFLTGMLCATLDHRGMKLRIPAWLSSLMAAAIIVAVYGRFPDTLSKPWAIALLGLGFYFILSGADIFGLLRLKASRRLGAISYDLYLCHGAILAATFAISPLRQIALGSPLAYWLILTPIVFVAVGVALALHIWIERPAIALGKRVVASLGTRTSSNPERSAVANPVSLSPPVAAE